MYIYFLGLSQARAKLGHLIFIDEPSLNTHCSVKLGSFTALKLLTYFVVTYEWINRLIYEWYDWLGCALLIFVIFSFRFCESEIMILLLYLLLKNVTQFWLDFSSFSRHMKVFVCLWNLNFYGILWIITFTEYFIIFDTNV